MNGSLKMVPNFRFAGDHDFGFDIAIPTNWQKFLESYTVEGQKLPRKTGEGNSVCYQVYDTKRKNLSLFPGYTPDGKKLPVYKYGYLR